MSDAGRETTSDIRPMVAQAPGKRGIWVFGGVAALAAGLLFYTLEARRTAVVPSIALPATAPDSTTISSPPDIQIPEEVGSQEMPAPVASTPSGAPYGAAPRMPGRAVYPPVPVMPSEPSPYVPPMPSAPRQQPSAFDPGGSSVVFNAASAPPSPGAPVATKQGERVSATVFQNPSTTIPLGTVIQAVLETALDSNRAGFARAIISKDVYGFDGTKILVPKGSRLIGEYKADLGAGQNRALVQWQRLMRPDGVIIDIDSPSADPLGRAGIRGKVNSHFLERFGGAILQSALDIGVQLATRSASRDTVVVALPGTATNAVSPVIATDKVQRTLTVKEGTSVSVFVSRDLDFSSVTQ